MRSKQPQLDADAIILRMREVFGVRYETELATALGLSKAAPSNWRQRNSPPYEICVELAREKGVSLDWLIFGIGDMRLRGRVEAGQDPERTEGPPAPSQAAERVSQFVYWWFVNRTQDEMIWLEQQFKRAVPEYGDWLTTQTSGDSGEPSKG